MKDFYSILSRGNWAGGELREKGEVVGVALGERGRGRGRRKRTCGNLALVKKILIHSIYVSSEYNL